MRPPRTEPVPDGGGVDKGVNERYHQVEMNAKQRKTLAAIFERPTRGDVSWKDIEALFKALGADVSEGRGSRVRVALGGRKAIFHRPHPKRTALRGMVGAVRDFLEQAGVHKP